jgi:hypothetical protein
VSKFRQDMHDFISAPPKDAGLSTEQMNELKEARGRLERVCSRGISVALAADFSFSTLGVGGVTSFDPMATDPLKNIYTYYKPEEKQSTGSPLLDQAEENLVECLNFIQVLRKVVADVKEPLSTK